MFFLYVWRNHSLCYCRSAGMGDIWAIWQMVSVMYRHNVGESAMLPIWISMLGNRSHYISHPLRNVSEKISIQPSPNGSALFFFHFALRLNKTNYNIYLRSEPLGSVNSKVTSTSANNVHNSLRKHLQAPTRPIPTCWNLSLQKQKGNTETRAGSRRPIIGHGSLISDKHYLQPVQFSLKTFLSSITLYNIPSGNNLFSIASAIASINETTPQHSPQVGTRVFR